MNIILSVIIAAILASALFGLLFELEGILKKILLIVGAIVIFILADIVYYTIGFGALIIGIGVLLAILVAGSVIYKIIYNIRFPVEGELAYLVEKATDGDLWAQLELADAYSNGKFSDRNGKTRVDNKIIDTKKAMKWYLVAAENDGDWGVSNIEAQYIIGKWYDEAGNEPEAIRFYKMAAEKGHQSAKERLEIITEPPDIKKRKSIRAAIKAAMDFVVLQRQIRKMIQECSNNQGDTGCLPMVTELYGFTTEYSKEFQKRGINKYLNPDANPNLADLLELDDRQKFIYKRWWNDLYSISSKIQSLSGESLFDRNPSPLKLLHMLDDLQMYNSLPSMSSYFDEFNVLINDHARLLGL